MGCVQASRCRLPVFSRLCLPTLRPLTDDPDSLRPRRDACGRVVLGVVLRCSMWSCSPALSVRGIAVDCKRSLPDGGHGATPHRHASLAGERSVLGGAALWSAWAWAVCFLVACPSCNGSPAAPRPYDVPCLHLLGIAGSPSSRSRRCRPCLAGLSAGRVRCSPVDAATGGRAPLADAGLVLSRIALGGVRRSTEREVVREYWSRSPPSRRPRNDPAVPVVWS